MDERNWELAFRSFIAGLGCNQLVIGFPIADSDVQLWIMVFTVAHSMTVVVVVKLGQLNCLALTVLLSKLAVRGRYHHMIMLV